MRVRNIAPRLFALLVAAGGLTLAITVFAVWFREANAGYRVSADGPITVTLALANPDDTITFSDVLGRDCVEIVVVTPFTARAVFEPVIGDPDSRVDVSDEYDLVIAFDDDQDRIHSEHVAGDWRFPPGDEPLTLDCAEDYTVGDVVERRGDG